MTEAYSSSGEIRSGLTGMQHGAKLKIMWIIEEILVGVQRSAYCKTIIGALPNWFGIESSNAEYIEGVANGDCFIARNQAGSVVGMLSLKYPFPNNGDIYWIGVLPEYHYQGIGRELVNAAFGRALSKGCTSITVATLGTRHPDEGYRKTRAFYKGMGFKPLFEITFEDYENAMLYMIRGL